MLQIKPAGAWCEVQGRGTHIWVDLFEVAGENHGQRHHEAEADRRQVAMDARVVDAPGRILLQQPSEGRAAAAGAAGGAFDRDGRQTGIVSLQ